MRDETRQGRSYQDAARQNMTILVGGEKGGTGKSTLAINLALLSLQAGQPTHLIDCDAQQTALKFANRRAAGGLKPDLICTHLRGDQLQVPIGDLALHYSRVIIDCGGQDSVELRSAMITPAVGLLLIPIRPGYFDLETLVNMNRLVRTSRQYHPDLMAWCVINCASTHIASSAATEAAQFIRDELKYINLCETVIHERVAFGYASAKGQGVTEYEDEKKIRDKKATLELSDLYLELFSDGAPVLDLPFATDSNLTSYIRWGGHHYE